MQVYLAGTTLTIDIDLVDADGNALVASAASYSVVDENGSVIVPDTPASDFTPDAKALSVTLDAEQTRLEPGVITAARSLEVKLTLAAGNTVSLSRTVAIRAMNPLMVGTNSFQTLAGARITAMAMPSLRAWNAASELEQVAAMIDARNRICRLRFVLFDNSEAAMQNSLNYVPVGARTTHRVGQFFNYGLEDLTPEQFLELPAKLRSALNYAQVAQADYALGGDMVDERRRQGMVLDTIGESKQMFRNGKPLELSVCRRALEYLGPHITLSPRMGRG